MLDDNNQPTEEYHEERELGFIAQEMLQVFPEIVSGSEEEFYDISYMRLGAIAAAGVAELKDLHDLEIADLNKRLEALENKLMNYGNDNN